ALVKVSLEEVGLDYGAMIGGNGSGGAGGGSPVVNVGGLVVKLDGPPRMYLLQKVVEIADYNMLRIRFEWSQIWRILQPYFNTIGCHPHPGVSTFAVDALRQINFKFLEKEELEHFSTQNELLKSFEWIMKYNTDPNIRELLLSSLSQMISARAGSIRSGWKSIFTVLSKPLHCQATTDRLILTSFQIVQTTFKDHFTVVSHAGGFVDYVACLTEFALMKNTAISDGAVLDEVVMGAVLILEECGRHLVELALEEVEEVRERLRKGVAVVSPQGAMSTTSSRTPTQPYILPTGIISEDQFVLKWFPILSSLSRVTIDSSSLTVKTRALDALFETLRSASRFFDVKYWKNIHRSVLLPIFEDLREHTRDEGDNGEKDAATLVSEAEVAGIALPKEGSSAIWIQGLRLLVDLFTDVFDVVAGSDTGIVADVLNLSIAMLKIHDEKLATSGQICLHQFIQKNIGKFGKADSWNLVTDAIESAFQITSPCELLNCDYGPKSTTPLPMSPASPAPGNSTLADIIALGREAAARMAPRTTLDTLDFEHTIVKCVTHIELIQAIRDVALTELIEASTSASRWTSTSMGNGVVSSKDLATLQPPGPVIGAASPLPVDRSRTIVAITIVPRDHRKRWLACIRESYAVARSFNADNDLRYAIWRRGLVQQMPNLVKQETISLAAHIRLLFAVYRVVGDVEAPIAEGSAAVFDIGEELIRHTLDVLERFVSFLTLDASGSQQQHNARDVALWGPVVVVIYQELLSMEGWWGVGAFGRRLSVTGETPEGTVGCEKLKRKLPLFFRLAIKMLNADKAEVRSVLQAFMERVADEIFGAVEGA
ncbi:guanine nucleotide exchange protein for ADP-robosylation factor, partial [Dinochytrium kinnereticum]